MNDKGIVQKIKDTSIAAIGPTVLLGSIIAVGGLLWWMKSDAKKNAPVSSAPSASK